MFWKMVLMIVVPIAACLIYAGNAMPATYSILGNGYEGDSDSYGDSDTEEDSDSNPGQGNGPPSSDVSVETGVDVTVDVKGGDITIKDEPNIYVPAAKGSSTGCDTSGAAVGIKVGGFSVSSPTYPCTVQRSYEALEHIYARDPNTNERKHGFITGTVPGFLLKFRLVTKGIFSAIAGLIGLG